MATALSLDDELPQHIAGSIPIQVDDFEQKLGRSAFHVWRILVKYRSPVDGVTYISQRGISRARGFAPIAEALVKDALRRLEASGLVAPLGWRTLPMGGRPDGPEREVYCRRILGSWAVRPGARCYLVPAQTWRWLQGARSWGGARRGAGRPKNQVPPTLETQIDVGGFESILNSSPPAEDPLFGNSNPPTKISLDLIKISSSLDVFSLREKTPTENPAGIDASSPAAPGGGGGGSGGPLRTMPPFPNLQRVPCASTPHPPRLQQDASDRELVDALLRAYRGCVSERYRTKCGVLFRGLKPGDKQYASILACARALREQDMAPAAWAAFSIDQWRQYGQNPKPPPITWVMASSRVEKHHGWFHAEESGYGGGRLVFGARHRELVQRYTDCQFWLAQNPGKLQHLLEHYFPGDLYERLVVDAKKEAVEIQLELNHKASRGDFLW